MRRRASYVGKHHLRLGSMGKMKRRLNDAREASGCDVCFCFFLYLCLFFCVNFLCVGACFLAFRCCSQSSFSLDCLSLVWSRCHSRKSCVLLLCFVSLIISTFPPTMFGFRHLFDFRSFILFCVTLLANSFLFLCSSYFLFIIIILIILFTCPQTQDDANFECRAFPR